MDIRTKNGIAAGEFATYTTVHGARVKMQVLSVTRGYVHPADGGRGALGDTVTITARVTSPSRFGYKRGEIVTMRDTAFLTRRPMPGQPPTDLIMRAMRAPGRSFLFNDAYAGGWTSWDRPPANARFWTIDGPKELAS